MQKLPKLLRTENQHLLTNIQNNMFKNKLNLYKNELLDLQYKELLELEACESDIEIMQIQKYWASQKQKLYTKYF